MWQRGGAEVRAAVSRNVSDGGEKKIFRFSAIVARFFPGVFWPEALRERAGGIGHLQRAGGVHRGFWCPKVLQHPQNELAEP